MIEITTQITLSDGEINISFIRASGPGGQNVNKVSSAVLLRFDAANSPSLPDPVKERLLRLAGRRGTKEGVILIKATRHRTQEMNRQDAMERLIAMIQQAATRPKKRRPTKPTKASLQRRLDAKLKRSETKKTRRQVRINST